MEGNEGASIDVNDERFFDHGEANEKVNEGEGFLPEDTEKIENDQENNELLDEQTEKIKKKVDENIEQEEKINDLEADTGENQIENFGNEEVKADDNLRESIGDLDNQVLEDKENDKVLGNIPFTDSNIGKIDKEEVNGNFFDEPGNFEQIFFKSEVNEDESLKNTQEKM